MLLSVCLLLPDLANQREKLTNRPWWALSFSSSPPFQKILWELCLPHTAGVLAALVLHSQAFALLKTERASALPGEM